MTAAPSQESALGDSGDSGDAAETDDPRATLRNFYATLAVTGFTAVVASAAVVAFLAGPQWSAAALVLLALFTTWFSTRDAIRRMPAGAAVAVRLIVVVAVLVAFGPSPGWLPATATMVAGLAILAEPPLTRLSRASVPYVSNLPGVAAAPAGFGRSRLRLLVNVSCLGLGALAGALGLPAGLWLAVAIVSAVLPTLTLIGEIHRLLAGRRIRRTMRAAITAYAPEFVVYTSRPDDASYQVIMWLPYLVRTGRRFLVVARSNAAAIGIAAHTEVPVVTCRQIADLDSIVQPSVRAAFYVNASSGNGAFVRYRQLTHVYLGHGDSDKPPSYNPTHAMYDKIFAAGPAAIARYAAHGVHIIAEKFEVVGRPQVESVAQVSDPRPPQTVLYAPTWRGHVTETMLYSLPNAERIVGALLDRGLTVVFRPHPFSYAFDDDAAVIERVAAMLRADAAATGRRHLFGAAAETDLSVIECINLSDAMISDVSSVVSDYLFSGKPFAMVAVPCPAAEFVGEYPIARAAYVIDGRLGDLDPVLDDLLGSDPLRVDRRRTRAEYLGDFPAEGYADRFVAACERAVDEAVPSDEAVDDTLDDSRAAVSWSERVRIQFAMYGSELTLATAALIATVLVAAGARTPAAVVALVTIVAVVVVSRRALRDRGSLDRTVGTVVGARAVAAAGLLVAAVVDGSPTGVVGAALLIALTVGEVQLRNAWTAAGTGIVNLPGCADPPLPRLPAGSVFVANLGALLMGWLLVFGGPDWILLGTSLVATVLFGAAAVLGARRLVGLQSADKHLTAELVAHGPRFAVYFGSGIGADYQVGMWLPYFDRIGSPYLIVTRTRGMLRVLASMTGMPVVHRPTLRSLEDVVVPTLTTAFYVNNAVRNTHFIERRELTHVWLNHGDSEKPACFNPVHAIYDRLFVAGQAGVDRYARHGVRIPSENFQIVGRPQVEQIGPARGPVASLTDVTVLYAPTWKGPYADTNVYSLPQGRRIVGALLAVGARVVFRAHPFNQDYPESRAAMRAVQDLLAADARRTGRDHIFGERAQRELTVEECFNLSDAMVADVSAVVSDYLKSAKPFSIVSIGRTPEQLVAEAPAAEAAYVLREDLANLDEVLAAMLGPDPLAPVRERIRRYYLGDFAEDTYADGFLDAARGVIDAPPQHALPDPQETNRKVSAP